MNRIKLVHPQKRGYFIIRLLQIQDEREKIAYLTGQCKDLESKVRRYLGSTDEMHEAKRRIANMQMALDSRIRMTNSDIDDAIREYQDLPIPPGMDAFDFQMPEELAFHAFMRHAHALANRYQTVYVSHPRRPASRSEPED